jgi:hypothetical protein
MSKFLVWIWAFGFLAMPVLAQTDEPEAKPKEARREKERPPRIPDAPFVPKRGMVKREKGQFWAGPPDEGRFAQILLLTLVPREQLQERLAEWPNYQELNGAQRARLVERIDEVRQSAQKQALEVAKEFQLQVGPGQEEDFVRMYWMERVQIDQALRQELFTKRKKLEGESEERIFRKFPKAIKN